MTEQKENRNNQLAANNQKIVNDFCITICTVNGSGSATANNVLYRTLFRMGIPVSGKNIFPSNIKGLPTWYVIRASMEGYLGRLEHDDIIIATNKDTFTEDLSYIVPGGVIFYSDHIDLPLDRQDIIAYPMPIKQLLKQADVPRNLRDYMENMLYVGIVGQILGINFDVVNEVLTSHFKGKPAVAESNMKIVNLGAEWAAENLEKKDHYYVEQMPPISDHILANGNSAGALGALFGGMQFCGWYPITPATSMVEEMMAFAPSLRTDTDSNKKTYAIVQAEDELAAIGMTVGAGWAGLRAMTSTSGPGLSLMAEYVGLAYFTETPVVIWDVQRVGPSTGMPTRTAQGDLAMCYKLGHGDTNYIILIPGSVTECFEFGWKAFDIAEQYQTPVFVLSDLDLGMNQWMTEKFEYPDKEINRGKILWEKDLEKWEGEWGRYLDVDGDGVPYRTVMGNEHPKSAYFTRGTGHDEFGNYSENPITWIKMINRIKKKFVTVREDLPDPTIRTKPNSKIGIIGMGSTDLALIEAQDILSKENIQVDYLRVRALPTNQMVQDFIKNHDRNYVFELNRDGQLCEILNCEVSQYSDKLISVSIVNGLPMTASWIVSQIKNYEEGK